MSPRTEETPTRVGDRYRLEERIGAGAMGAVWRATDERLNRTVAVKQLLAAASHTGASALEESRQRILREGRIGARLQHAHVISMFDVVVHDDSPWLVMEYLPSLSLAQVLGSKGPLPPLEVADIGRQVADGLSAAHLAGVVHRDVKPGNVLIGEDGRVKLTDFGVSRAVDDVQLTRTGLIAGTPAFLSPEVAQGREPTAASDVFALGATLYAAVEGSPPFGLNDNAYALLHKVATSVPAPPKQAGPLTGVMMRLLSVDPADRPSAAQARDELAAVVAGRVDGHTAPATAVLAAGAIGTGGAGAAGPGTVTDLQAPTPAPAPARRRRRTPVLLGILAALLVAGGGITAALLTNGSTAVPPAALPAATTSAVPPPASPTPSPTPTPAPTTTASTTTPAPPPADSGQLVSFVQNYYSLLPGDPDAAWEMLGPEAQARSNGRDNYVAFYQALQNVSLQDVRQSGADSVDATVVFDRGGVITHEPYRFVMSTGSDGKMIMESFSKA